MTIHDVKWHHTTLYDTALGHRTASYLTPCNLAHSVFSFSFARWTVGIALSFVRKCWHPTIRQRYKYKQQSHQRRFPDRDPQTRTPSGVVGLQHGAHLLTVAKPFDPRRIHGVKVEPRRCLSQAGHCWPRGSVNRQQLRLLYIIVYTIQAECCCIAW